MASDTQNYQVLQIVAATVRQRYAMIDLHHAIEALLTQIAAPILLVSQEFELPKRGFSTAMAR